MRSMTVSAQTRARWLVVAAFAVAMAWMESATVYYLRLLVDRVTPYQADPLPMHGNLGGVELVREAATLVMLLAIGIVAGDTRRARLGYAAIAFGVWDIFYYVFLRVMSGWPTSLFDWDILFLLPLPWWGPVIAPLCIAALMIVWGTLVILPRHSSTTHAGTSIIGGAGIALALYVFMADAIHLVGRGIDVTRTTLPVAFNWRLFAVALALMAVPVVQLTWPGSKRPSTRRAYFPNRSSRYALRGPSSPS
jgi:hypothetical protein